MQTCEILIHPFTKTYIIQFYLCTPKYLFTLKMGKYVYLGDIELYIGARIDQLV
jgi:hypothetical protein